MTEILNKRTYTQKVFDMGNSMSKYRCYVSHKHYKDGSDFKDIDTRLAFSNSKWRHNKASYIPEIAEYADEWFSFQTQYEGNDFIVLARPVASHVLGVYHEDSTGTYVVYTDAFGAGIDLKVYAYHGGVKKVICINSAPADTSTALTFDFEMTLPAGTSVKDFLSQVEWDIQNGVDFKGKTITLNDANGEVFFRDAQVWDSGEDRLQQSVDIELYKSGNKIYLRKTITPEVLQSAVYPLYTDHPTSYDAGSGDGYAGVNSLDFATWDLAHDAAVGGVTTVADLGAMSRWLDDTGSGAKIQRCFIPIDTSGIDNGATITSASLNVNVELNRDCADAYGYIRVVQTTQASTSTLSTTDYPLCGAVDNPTSGGQLDLGDTESDGTYTSIPLNSTGIGWIDDEGWTKLGLRSGHDAEDVKTGAFTRSGWQIVSSSEDSGSSKEPYLEVLVAEDPIYADVDGDGRVLRSGDSDWATTHDTADGTSAQDTGTTGYIGVLTSNFVGRGFFPFDTSALTGTVAKASLFVYCLDKGDNDDDGNNWINVVEGLQASTSGLAVGDYDACGDSVNDPTEGATRIDLADHVADGYQEYVLDATGISWINLGGWTKLGLREGHDCVNEEPVGNSYININFAEQTGQQPFLLITLEEDAGSPIQVYSRGDVAVLPTGVADMETNFSAQDIIDVASDDDTFVSQTATGEFAVFKFNDLNESGHGVTAYWKGKSNVAAGTSTVYLQIYNYDTVGWETLDSDNSTGAGTEFTLQGTIALADVADYVDSTNYFHFRVYQDAP